MKHKNKKLRLDFPILQEKIYGKQLIYLDSAATSLTPVSVITTISEYYKKYSSNIHRGAYYTSHIIGKLYELSRSRISSYIGSQHASSIIFTKGTTESINFVAQSFLLNKIKRNSEILITIMEHHSNIVPWQRICTENKATLNYIYLKKSGDLDKENLLLKITKKTKILSITHVSNVLGTVNPVGNIVEYAHHKNIFALIDGAQAISHFHINISLIKPDFYVFSGHKVCGPTGIGILYIDKYLLENIKPYQTGGGGVYSVSVTKTTSASAPRGLEAGTPNISGVLGFNEAIEYVRKIDIQNVYTFEYNIMSYAKKSLQGLNYVRIIGTPFKRKGALSFIIKNIHPHDISTILDRNGIAVRGGLLCVEPLLNYLRTGPITRVSLSFYNNFDEVNMLKNALEKLIWIFENDN